MRWFTLVRATSPLQRSEGILPRLYRRTVEDAAFQILDGELTPGFGQSGKMHNYISSLPLEEMSNQAGVRRDLPIEIVFETSAVLRYAYVFETASDAVLCREKVPGSTKILYSRPIDTPASGAAVLWTTLAPRKSWPSLQALLQARIWLSSLSNHARGLLPIWSSRAPCARTTVASASSTAASAPSLCAI